MEATSLEYELEEAKLSCVALLSSAKGLDADSKLVCC